MASENPSPEDKLKYDAAKKELMQALAKRREVDKHLVRPGSPLALLSLIVRPGPPRGANLQLRGVVLDGYRGAQRW